MQHRALVGLGNPGDRYRNTRHNVGWMVLEQAVRRWNADPFKTRGKADTTSLRRGELKVHLIKPLTFMNLSGQALHALRRETGIEPAHVLCITDDFALPLGQLRLRESGSAGGHNGLKSLIAELGTNAFPRLRTGIGPVPEGWDPADFVLGRFAAAESEALSAMVERSVDCIETWMDRGAAAAMNGFNR